MNKLREYLEEKNIENIEEKLIKFDCYYNLLSEWNEKFNLTAIIEKNEVELKHFIDSLTALDFLESGDTIADIGSGAGFPAIPLAIIKEDCSFVLVDSLNKRVGFLNEVKQKLQLKNIHNIHSRAEDFANKNRENFDIVTARAVAKLNTLAEICIPIVKVGGRMLAYKSTGAKEEIIEAENAFNMLNCKVISANEFLLPGSDIHRCIIEIEKYKQTDRLYPRGGNKPKSNPI